MMTIYILGNESIELNKTVRSFSGISLVNDSFNKAGISQSIDSELSDRVK